MKKSIFIVSLLAMMLFSIATAFAATEKPLQLMKITI